MQSIVGGIITQNEVLPLGYSNLPGVRTVGALQW